MWGILKYLYEKLIGAGFSFSMFILVVFMMIHFDLYELSATLQNPWIWIAFYPYAIGSSVLIDIILYVIPVLRNSSSAFKLMMHQLFGLLPFVIMMFPSIPLIIITGIVGILCASIFYTGIKLVVRRNVIAFIFAMIIPIICTCIMSHDFTVKRNWQEVTSKDGYQVNFDYFNGHHTIPIEMEKGDIMNFQVEVYARNDGGWGNYVHGPHHDSIPMEIVENNDLGDEQLRFTAKEKGTYYIVVTGTRLKGAIVVNWNIS